MADLKVKNVSVSLQNNLVVNNVSFDVTSGEFVVVLGANGAGKSTLIKAALGIQSVSTGIALIGGQEAHSLSPIDKAKQVAYLPQKRPLAWPNTVRDVVSLGRFCYGAVPGKLQPLDAEAVDSALIGCGLDALANRSIDTLSGGEVARVHCARAIASQAPLLIADEPTAALDPKHQLMVMDLIEHYVRRGGGALVVLHDISLALRYASRLLWMSEGRVIADGSPENTVTEARLAEVYGVKARVEAGGAGTRIELLSVL